MSYIFDVYRGLRRPVTDFADYAVFVSFFPLLVAGPIERANHLLPQVQSRRIFRYHQAVAGGKLILWGLFKKVVVADSLAPMVDRIFADYHAANAFTLLFGMVIFSFQIYGDFSGYSDVAIGTAKLFGFELLSNFRFPYFSRNIPEFWRRWHISLFSWFRDYVYIPLGGAKTKWHAVRNTFIVFLLSGFWHGAAWKYILLVSFHAFAFLPYLLFPGVRDKKMTETVAQSRTLPSLRELAGMCSTFMFVSAVWLLFRAPDIPVAWDYLLTIFRSATLHPAQFTHRPQYIMALAYIVPLVCIEWTMRHNEREVLIGNSLPRYVRYAFYALSTYFILSKFGDNISFIYFQF